MARVKDYREVTEAAVTRESGVLFEAEGFHAVRSPVQLVGTEQATPVPMRTVDHVVPRNPQHA